jgi:hypothetical protein
VLIEGNSRFLKLFVRRFRHVLVLINVLTTSKKLEACARVCKRVLQNAHRFLGKISSFWAPFMHRPVLRYAFLCYYIYIITCISTKLLSY